VKKVAAGAKRGSQFLRQLGRRLDADGPQRTLASAKSNKVALHNRCATRTPIARAGAHARHVQPASGRGLIFGAVDLSGARSEGGIDCADTNCCGWSELRRDALEGGQMKSQRRKAARHADDS